MDYHHLLEAAGTVVSGVLFYSLAYSWFAPDDPRRRPLWVAAMGLVWGGLAIILMISRIQTVEGIFVDGRVIPVAVIGLFEGGWAALIAAFAAAAYRVWLGGSGATAGVVTLLAVAAAAALSHRWARVAEKVRVRHAFVLAVATFFITFGGFGLLGERGRAMFARFRAVLDDATDAVRVVDGDSHRIIDCNRADCDLSALSRAQLVGRDSREFWPSPAAHGPAAAPTDGSGSIARALGVPFQTASGRLIAVDSTRRVVAYRGRRYEIIIYRDAAERLAGEEARREAASLRSVNLLAQAAAHEINNPLAIIMGYIQMLEDRLPPGTEESSWTRTCRNAAVRIRDAVGRLSRIVRVESTQPSGTVPPILDMERSTSPRPDDAGR